MQTDSVTDEFIRLVNAAINLLDVTCGACRPHPPICDANLWEHVEGLARIEAWSEVSATVATFVDGLRKRGGPTPRDGTRLVGSDLFNRVLGDYPSGGQEGSGRGGGSWAWA